MSLRLLLIDALIVVVLLSAMMLIMEGRLDIGRFVMIGGIAFVAAQAGRLVFAKRRRSNR